MQICNALYFPRIAHATTKLATAQEFEYTASRSQSLYQYIDTYTQKLIRITFLSSTVTSDLRWRISWKKEVGDSFLSALTTQHCGFTQAAPYAYTLSNTHLRSYLDLYS